MSDSIPSPFNRQACGLVRSAVAAAALLLLCAAAPAQAELYIQLGTIKGESTAENHKDWSDIDSLSWGVSASHDIHGVTRLDFQDLSWSQLVDRSYPPLLTALTKGTPLDTKVDFTTNHGSDQELVYFTMEFKAARLTSLQLSASSGGPAVFSASLDYEQIKFSYQVYDDTGKKVGGAIIAGWDLKKAKPLAGDGVAGLGALYAQGLAGPTFVDPLPVPEPGSLAMMLAGLLGVGAVLRRRRCGRD